MCMTQRERGEPAPFSERSLKQNLQYSAGKMRAKDDLDIVSTSTWPRLASPVDEPFSGRLSTANALLGNDWSKRPSRHNKAFSLSTMRVKVTSYLSADSHTDEHTLEMHSFHKIERLHGSQKRLSERTGIHALVYRSPLYATANPPMGMAWFCFHFNFQVFSLACSPL